MLCEFHFDDQLFLNQRDGCQGCGDSKLRLVRVFWNAQLIGCYQCDSSL